MSDKPDVRDGLLEAKARVDLRDYFAGCALAGMCTKGDFRRGNDALRASLAYEQADAMVEARDAAAVEHAREKALVAIGELAVADFIGTGDVNLIGEQLKRALESFVAESKAADTLPAGPPDEPADASPPAGETP